MIIKQWPLFLFFNSLIIPLPSACVVSPGSARMGSPCFVVSEAWDVWGEISNPGVVSVQSFWTVTTFLLFIGQTNIQEWRQLCIQPALFKISQNSKYLQIYCPSMTASCDNRPITSTNYMNISFCCSGGFFFFFFPKSLLPLPSFLSCLLPLFIP